MLEDYEREEIKDTIESEGFEYTFMSYTTFPKIQDQKFQMLRKAFVNAYDELNNYIND